MARWNIKGQVGSILKSGNIYVVNIAMNIYSGSKKKDVIWFNCISDFEPRVDVGDSVLAEGSFVPSLNSKHPYSMKISYIGVIEKKPREE